MALDYLVLKNKKLISRTSSFDGGTKLQALDLLTQSVTEFNPLLATLVKVQKEYIARPDLISLAVYGTDKYADIICKVNGISNPFELNENMYILCPDVGEITNLVNISPEANKFIKDPDNESILDSSVKSNKKMLNEKRSPVEATIFDHNYTIIEGARGLVFY